ncbi:putative dehydrogenase [Arthrobacter pascens]|uniref:Gfo/Idh/MocA family protein n=1 Tax=Arthrobacter pascens TaxID=1677 RepID=UPI00285BAD98|nr:Gfo/Idh/MocA family oxidoreductase [Arthrobacter pascens]MDR6557672.1 putative dehydrogenase [Arthrobacter pascens]
MNESVKEVGLPYGRVDSHNPALKSKIEAALEIPEFNRTIPVGLVGCGWVAGQHLRSYRAAGVNVVALCDSDIERAKAYREEFYPDAVVYRDEQAMLAHPGLEVVDIATHVAVRPQLVRQAVRAGKHVLSQKPFVEDLSEGLQLAREARDAGVILAVNQNGRWTPHFGALLACIGAGLIGDVVSADFFVAWPHDLFVEDKPAFAAMEDLVLYDFGAHWFDLIGTLVPEGALEVRAVTASRKGQSVPVPMQAHALISADNFIASVGFRAAERYAESGTFRVSGTRGVITHEGLSLGGDSVVVSTDDGEARISVSNDWFGHGMIGAMRPLLIAIESGLEPFNSPASSLTGLSLCFAAIESAATGKAVTPDPASARRR